MVAPSSAFVNAPPRCTSPGFVITMIQRWEEHMTGLRTWAAAAVLVQCLGAGGALALDKVKVAIGNPGVGETEVPDLGTKQGIFRKHGLELEILYTQGSAETVQAVLSGGADVGCAVGTLGALATFAKGAPIRIIGASFTGDSNMFLYVPTTSSIQKVEDTAGKSVAFSNSGSSSHMMVLEAKKQFNVDFKPTGTGGGPATLTQVMSGQVDVGWSGAPFAVDLLEAGRIRLIMKASDLTAMAGQTSRVIVASQQDLQKRADVYKRFMQAYRETIDWIYDTPDGVKAYSDWAKVPENIGRRSLNEFLPKVAVDPDRVMGLDQNMRTAIEFKYLTAPLSQQQLDELVKIPPRS
jgi:NitT/TauT family transport system substrate-binding protein